ncbi:MAG: hypothetical protein U0531_06100 [Dehalococcoidia bacterium]
MVDAARTARTGGGPALFYLLDEILQGTNTHERQIAARQIVMHLVHQGALRRLHARPHAGGHAGTGCRRPADPFHRDDPPRR